MVPNIEYDYILLLVILQIRNIILLVSTTKKTLLICIGMYTCSSFPFVFPSGVQCDAAILW